MKTPIQIPFDPITGHQQHYPQVRYQRVSQPVEPIWKDNHEFEATLTFRTFCRGRSAAYSIFADGKGQEYSIFLTDLADIIPKMVNGVVTGTFTYCKRGQNYGTKVVS